MDTIRLFQTAFNTVEQLSNNTKIVKPPNQCNYCNKKLKLEYFECKCNNIFCSTHRYSYMHNCSFDHKKNYQKILQEKNPVVIANKINKI